jgi:hypothetical protein
VVTDEATKLQGFVPFEGKLRAGRVVGQRSVMVNASGRVFCGSLKAPPPP